MKYVSDNRGFLPIVVVVAIALLVIAGGLAVYSVSKSNHKNVEVVGTSTSPPAATASTLPTPTPTPTDQELIAAAVKTHLQSIGEHPLSGAKIILNKLQDDDAMVNVTSAEGGGRFELLKKNSGTWSVVFGGQNISPSTESSLGFPQGFTSSGTFGNTVLYRY